MRKLQALINGITGRLFWYEIEYDYKANARGAVLFTFWRKVGRPYKSDILEDRMRKVGIDKNIYNGVASYLLCNGVITARVVCYFGWIKSNVSTHPL